jgi:hypothetical protein
MPDSGKHSRPNYDTKNVYSADTWAQCYKTFYSGNLPPSHGNTVILCYKALLPWKLLWNGGILPWYFNPRKSRVKIATVIYCGIVL